MCVSSTFRAWYTAPAAATLVCLQIVPSVHPPPCRVLHGAQVSPACLPCLAGALPSLLSSPLGKAEKTGEAVRLRGRCPRRPGLRSLAGAPACGRRKRAIQLPPLIPRRGSRARNPSAITAPIGLAPDQPGAPAPTEYRSCHCEPCEPYAASRLTENVRNGCTKTPANMKGQNWRLHWRSFSHVLCVRRRSFDCLVCTLSRRKQGFEFPRERQ